MPICTKPQYLIYSTMDQPSWCVTALHFQDWKSEEYRRLIGSGQVPPRPGVLRLMDEARAAGYKVAVCSAATKESVVFTLQSLLGPERFNSLDCFMAGDDVPRKKPDPIIYQLASGSPTSISPKTSINSRTPAIHYRPHEGCGHQLRR